MPDGARHVLLMLVAVFGGIALFGASFYFCMRPLAKRAEARSKAPAMPERPSWRQSFKWHWDDFWLEMGVHLALGLSIAIPAAFVWLLMRFW